MIRTVIEGAVKTFWRDLKIFPALGVKACWAQSGVEGNFGHLSIGVKK